MKIEEMVPGTWDEVHGYDTDGSPTDKWAEHSAAVAYEEAYAEDVRKYHQGVEMFVDGWMAARFGRKPTPQYVDRYASYEAGYDAFSADADTHDGLEAALAAAFKGEAGRLRESA